MRYVFDSIAGYEQEKEELKRLCEIFNNREKYQKKGAKLPKGIIFYGEAGTGKTLFSKVMASECGLDVLKISIAEAENENHICKVIKKTFAKAERRKAPTMIFFDELDKVVPNEEERYYTDRAKTVLAQLLTLIDGMDSSGNVVFVATCNDYDVLPETLVRPGRIDKKIGIGLPNFSSRVEILKMYAKKSSCRFEMAIEDMAKLCVGLSCAALETLVNECILQSDENGNVSEELVKTRFFEIKNEDIPRERSSVDDFINACKNVGTFVVAKAFNSGHYTLTIEKNAVCNNFFNSIVSATEQDDDDWDDDDYDEDDDYSSIDSDCDEEENADGIGTVFSKSDYLNAISVLYGGYVAQEVVLHKVYDNVGGALRVIDKIVELMLNNAMFGINLRYSTERNDYILPYSDGYRQKINALFEEVCETCYNKAKGIVEKNAELIENLSKVLTERQIIQEDDCEELIKEFGSIKL